MNDLLQRKKWLLSGLFLNRSSTEIKARTSQKIQHLRQVLTHGENYTKITTHYSNPVSSISARKELLSAGNTKII